MLSLRCQLLSGEAGRLLGVRAGGTACDNQGIVGKQTKDKARV